MGLRAIVFDFDGVIANSEPLHYRAFRDVLALHGVELAEADYYARYLGFDDVGVYREVGRDRGRPWTTGEIAALVEAKAAQMEVLESQGSLLFPGAASAIRRAAGRMPIAIASGALGDEIRRILEHEALGEYFTAIVAAEDTPVSKPAADPYLRAVALLAERTASPIRAAECIAVEDSPWGLTSARAAGLRTVAVAHTYEASALEADVVIATLDDLDLDRLGRLCA